MSKAAETVPRPRRQPDGFPENVKILDMLVAKWTSLLPRWLKTHCPRDCQRHVLQSRVVAHEVKHWNNVWFHKKARKFEIAVRKAREAWKGLRET